MMGLIGIDGAFGGNDGCEAGDVWQASRCGKNVTDFKIRHPWALFAWIHGSIRDRFQPI